jgi:hypothetical protein
MCSQATSLRPRSSETGPPADCTLTAATEDELRRRATEGDTAAMAELTRRRAAAEQWVEAAA